MQTRHLTIAVAIALVVIHLLEALVKRLTAKMELRVATIFINLVRGTVWVIALLSVLEPVFNIQPTAFVTALGTALEKTRVWITEVPKTNWGIGGKTAKNIGR